VVIYLSCGPKVFVSGMERGGNHKGKGPLHAQRTFSLKM